MELYVELGTFLLILVAFSFLLITRWICKSDNISGQIDTIDKFMVFGLLVRVIWAIAVGIMSRSGYHYLVWDDESYYRFAMRQISERSLSGVNVYQYILRFLYDVFGRTSATGRIVNMFLSLSTIYPLATIEKRLNADTEFSATKMMAYSPFMIFISFFEIKDLFILFLFTSSYAIVKRLQERVAIPQVLLLFIICIISEEFRSGTGIIPIGVLIVTKLRLLGSTKRQRHFFAFIGILLLAIAAIYVGQSYILEQTGKINQYRRWIVTQFSSRSIYNWLVIAKIQDVWKAPLCFIIYALQPLDVLAGSFRYFSDFAMIAKFVDIPILVCSILFLPKFIKKEKWNSLFFLILYTFTSCINFTNARQGFFLYPIMYLIFFDGISSFGEYEYENSETGLLVADHRKHWRTIVKLIYLVWFLFLVYRIAR